MSAPQCPRAAAEAIAARLGLPLSPGATVQRIPRGVSAFDYSQPQSPLGDPDRRAVGSKIRGRQIRFEALKRREASSLADAVADHAQTRALLKGIAAAEKRRAKPGRKKVAKLDAAPAGLILAQRHEMAWRRRFALLELLQSGMSATAVAALMGINVGSIWPMLSDLRKRGEPVPDLKARAGHAVNTRGFEGNRADVMEMAIRRRWAMCELLQMGMAPRDAAAAMGIKTRLMNSIIAWLRSRGEHIPTHKEAKGRSIRAAVADCLRRGLSIAETCAEVGCGDNMVCEVKAKMLASGEKIRRVVRKKKHHPQREAFEARVIAGECIRDVAREMGLQIGTAEFWARMLREDGRLKRKAQQRKAKA